MTFLSSYGGNYMTNITRQLLTWIAGLLALTIGGVAQAEPILQLYVEGATYDDTTDTWVGEPGSEVNVWVIANTAGGGSKGTVFDVNLVIAYDASNTAATFGNNGPEQFDLVATGTGSHSVLAPHGIYDSETAWQQFALGDFTETQDPLADFNADFQLSDLEGTTGADIEVYSLTIQNVEGGIHLDAFGTVILGGSEKVYAAPYSHDAEITNVPELSANGLPNAVAFMAGTAAVAVASRRQRREI